MIRVLIVEDQPMIRGALVVRLSLQVDVEVVTEMVRGDTVAEEVAGPVPMSRFWPSTGRAWMA